VPAAALAGVTHWGKAAPSSLSTPQYKAHELAAQYACVRPRPKGN